MILRGLANSRPQVAYLPHVALAAALLLLVSCRPGAGKWVRIDPALAALVPTDTVYLLGAHMESLSRTPAWQKLQTLALPDLNRFTQATGLDPRRDVREVLVCSNGTGAVTVLRGSFRESDLASKLQSAGAHTLSYKGNTLYVSDHVAVTFLDSSLAAAGTTAAVERIVDAHDRGGSGLPSALQALVQTIPARDQLWAVRAGGSPGMRFGENDESRLGSIVQMLRGIRTIVLGIDFSDGLDLSARVQCESDNDATHIHDALRGAIGFARLNTPDNHPELLKVYDAIQVSQEKSLVTASASVSSEQVDQALDVWLKRTR
jgi:hypothetical protein